MDQQSASDVWPSLPFELWSETFATLHMWTQIVGKVRLVQSPWLNHSWHATFYVTATGLSTSPVPYGNRMFQIDFDFVSYQLRIQSADGATGGFALEPQSVAVFYARVMEEMRQLQLDVRIRTTPNEVVDAIRFDQDDVHRAYDREYAGRFWRILVQADRVFTTFRARFIGKCSPVHFFWGAPDLAVTRFSGRRAPEHPGGVPNLPDRVTREAYSHEVSSCGFWPADRFHIRRSIPTPIRSRRVSRMRPASPPKPSTAPTCGNSSCHTRSCGRRRLRTTRCWIFSRRRMRRRRDWRSGTVRRWSASRNSGR